MSYTLDVKPVVGMGATIPVGSDRYPATIVEVRKDGKEIDVQWDFAIPTKNNDPYGNQEYTYSRDPDATILTFTLRKTGRYVVKGESLNNGRKLILGVRQKYWDPHF